MKVIIKTGTICSKQESILGCFKNVVLLLSMIFFSIENANCQSCNNKIGDFTSVDASTSYFSTSPIFELVRSETLVLPNTHTFQKIIFTDEIDLEFNIGLSAYVPENGSSTQGFLSINNGIRATPDTGNGRVAVLDMKYNETTKLWMANNSQYLNFSAAGGTSKNSSGAVTPWGTFITSENHEIDGGLIHFYNQEINDDGYYKYGWQVEIDAANKKVLGKRYEMGRFKHENAAIHPNKRTIYQGDDSSSSPSYLYKFVADSEENLTSGKLYVYKADGDPEPSSAIKCAGKGKWLLLDNKGPGDINITGDCNAIGDNYDKGSNNVKYQAACLGATSFNKMEDVEIGPDGKVYFIEPIDNVIYYLEDLDPEGLITDPDKSTVNFLGNYVGGDGKIYKMKTESGVIIEEPWKSGPDNMEFDKEGNLYICQDNGEAHIWMVEKDHTQTIPKVKVMALTPKHFVPKGITFSPDNRFMFLSLAMELDNNTEEQNDVAETPIVFNKSMVIVIARKEYLGINRPINGCTDVYACNFDATATENDCSCKYTTLPCDDGNPNTINDTYDQTCTCVGESFCNTKVVVKANAVTGALLQKNYVSSRSIETEITISDSTDVVIRSNESVNLKSANIKLNKGFKVEKGGCLNATIEPCTQ